MIFLLHPHGKDGPETVRHLLLQPAVLQIVMLERCMRNLVYGLADDAIGVLNSL